MGNGKGWYRDAQHGVAASGRIAVETFLGINPSNGSLSAIKPNPFLPVERLFKKTNDEKIPRIRFARTAPVV